MVVYLLIYLIISVLVLKTIDRPGYKTKKLKLTPIPQIKHTKRRSCSYSLALHFLVWFRSLSHTDGWSSWSTGWGLESRKQRSVRLFLEMLNRKTHPECGWVYPEQAGTLDWVTGAEVTPRFLSLGFLTVGAVWPATVAHHALPTIANCIFSSCEPSVAPQINPSFPPFLLSAAYPQ